MTDTTSTELELKVNELESESKHESKLNENSEENPQENSEENSQENPEENPLNLVDYQLFIKNNLQELIQITIKERLDKGPGSLFIGYDDTTKKVDCLYYPLGDKCFPDVYKELYISLFEKNPSSVIYFHYYYNNSDNIAEYDLNKNQFL